MELRWAVPGAAWGEGAAGSSACELEVRAERERGVWVVEARLWLAGRSRALTLPGGTAERVCWTVESPGDLYHLDIPGVVAATVAPGRRGARCLFARTPLAKSLGVRGGRCEFRAATLIGPPRCVGP